MSEERAEAVHEIERLLHEITWRDRRQFARQVSEFRLSALQYLALHEIGQLGPNVTMGEIGAVIQVPPSSMTNIVDRLVAAGLVVRGSAATDRRAVAVNLTDSGSDLIKQVEVTRRDNLDETLKDQPAAALNELAAGLGVLLKGMNDR